MVDKFNIIAIFVLLVGAIIVWTIRSLREDKELIAQEEDSDKVANPVLYRLVEAEVRDHIVRRDIECSREQFDALMNGMYRFTVKRDKEKFNEGWSEGYNACFKDYNNINPKP